MHDTRLWSRAGFVTAGASALLLPACSEDTSASPRVRADLYDCENCEITQERDPATLSARVTLAGADEPGERLVLRGRVLTHDARAPARDVVIYAHHTNADGLYANGSNENIWARRHGRLRGWARTGADGTYEFSTIKPAPYPDRSMPAHIHLYVLEPGRRPYWIDDVVFAGEFRVNDAYRRRMENRGGSGIVELARENGAWLARRDILLEPHPA
jgi:protocatechuate 3,4-dioxygenase beta subunit